MTSTGPSLLDCIPAHRVLDAHPKHATRLRRQGAAYEAHWVSPSVALAIETYAPRYEALQLLLDRMYVASSGAATFGGILSVPESIRRRLCRACIADGSSARVLPILPAAVSAAILGGM